MSPRPRSAWRVNIVALFVVNPSRESGSCENRYFGVCHKGVEQVEIQNASRFATVRMSFDAANSFADLQRIAVTASTVAAASHMLAHDFPAYTLTAVSAADWIQSADSSASSASFTILPLVKRILFQDFLRQTGFCRSKNSRPIPKCLNSSFCASFMIALATGSFSTGHTLLVPVDRPRPLPSSRGFARESACFLGKFLGRLVVMIETHLRFSLRFLFE